MFILLSDYKKQLIILFILTILLGSFLVKTGGYISDKYFSRMVSGLIGEYGEYDLLFILSIEKEDIAIEQINKVIELKYRGAVLKKGPRVVGSSNYLLKLPDEYHNQEIYSTLHKNFSDIPGMMSKTIISEPRLSVRGFRGETYSIIRPAIEEIEGVDYFYRISDGIDLVLEEAEDINSVKEGLTKVLNKYQILEIRYPLNQHSEELEPLRKEIIDLLEEESDINGVHDITRNVESDRVSLLKSLNQMKTFLLSYATKVSIENTGQKQFSIGSELIIPGGEQEDLILEVIDFDEKTINAIIQRGEIKTSDIKVYYRNEDGSPGIYLGAGSVNNPRQNLADTLTKLNEITPKLNVFLEQSELLINYSDTIANDLAEINKGLSGLEESSVKLSTSLEEWNEKNLSLFLQELLGILDEIKASSGNLDQIQVELVKTSNTLKEVSGQIEEKLIYVPRNNEIYKQLNSLKEFSLKLSTALDNNYDEVNNKVSDMDTLLMSIDDWQIKINSLLNMEDILTDGASWEEIDSIIKSVEEANDNLDTEELEKKLLSIQEILYDIKTTQLPLVLEQLKYIQGSLPDLEEKEIIESVNLIDKYLAGQVIPGDNIQLLIDGDYNSRRLNSKILNIVNNSTVSIYNMESGYLQTNPRGEVLNILRQIKAVISTIIALIFTLLIMIFDQSLFISVIRLNRGNGLIYGFVSGGLIFTLIYLIAGVNFPYLNIYVNLLIGGLTGLIIALISTMLNPVSKEEWEAGEALGFSFSEIMQEIIIPAGKPGLLYLINYPEIIFK